MANCPTCGKSDIQIRSKGSCVIGYCDACGEWKGLEGDKTQQTQMIEKAKEEERQKEAYDKATIRMAGAQKKKSAEEYLAAKKEFEKLGVYQNAKQKAEECQKAAKKIQNKKRRHERAMIAIAFLISLGISSLYMFRIHLPSKLYKEAKILLEQGEYTDALKRFDWCGNYQDAENQTDLCIALISLHLDDPETTLNILSSLQEKKAEAGDTLKEELFNLVKDWKTKNISAYSLLTLLTQQKLFDPEGSLDREQLFLEAHVELAGRDDIEEWYQQTEDDGTKKLVVLRTNGNVEMFEMTNLENDPIIMDRAMKADCLLSFGARLLESDPEKALRCNLAALEERPDAEARSESLKAYQQCALHHEKKGDYSSALEDAKNGFMIQQTQESFLFYVQLMQRYCAASEDMEQGIVLWKDFCEKENVLIDTYNMEEETQSYTGKLCLHYALALASWCDDTCLDWFEEAKKEGAKTEEALLEAVEFFDLGRTRIGLRYLLLKEYEEKTKLYQEQRVLIAEEIGQILEKSTISSIEAEDRLVILLYAKELEILPDSIDAKAMYREALAEASHADQMTEVIEVDWNQDGWTELVGLDTKGCLTEYSVTTDGLIHYVQKEAGFSKIEILEREQTFLLLTDEKETTFAVYYVQDGIPVKQFLTKGLARFSRENFMISFECLMEGSIPRYECYTYEIGSDTDSAVYHEIIWQKDSYPLPQTPENAVIQALEAFTLELQEEFELLKRPEKTDEWMSYGDLSTLPKPTFPLTITCAPYWTEENRQLVRVRYQTEDGIEVRYFSLNQDEAGIWRLSGVSEKPLSIDNWREEEITSHPWLCLNEPIQDVFNTQGEKRIYQIVLPYDAKVTLLWQSGDSDGKKEAYEIVMTKKDTPEEPIFSYTLKASKATQQSRAIFLDAGIYQIQITAGEAEFGAYTLELLAQAGIEMEHEPNDTLTEANKIKTDQKIYGALSQKEDVDVYTFTLDQQAAVSIYISSEEEQNFSVQLADGVSRQLLRKSEIVQNESTKKTYLAAGSYLVQIESGGVWTGAEYDMTIHTEEIENCEAEQNNTMESANLIAVNQTISGDSAVKGDVDYFSFRLDEASTVVLNMTFPETKSEEETYRLSLLSDTAYTLWSQTGVGKEGIINSGALVLMPGNYMVEVANLKWNNSSYTIQVLSETVNAEKESNDALKAANQIETNSAIFGSLLPMSEEQEQDIDTYQFVLDDPGRISLELTYEKQPYSSSVYQLTLADENTNVVWSEGADGDRENLTSGNIWLDKGVYLVQLSEGRRSSPTAYQLTLSYAEDNGGEQEPNDRNPAELQYDHPLRGSFATEDDVDLFALTLEEETTVRLVCRVEDTEKGKIQILLKQEENILWRQTFLASEGKMESNLQIPVGNYILELKSEDDWCSVPYILSLEKVKNTDGEREE